MKILTIIFLGAVLFTTGCAAQSNTPQTPQGSQTPKTTQPSSTKPSQTTTQATTTPPQTTQTSQTSSTTPKVTSWPTPPAMQIDPSKQYFATVNTSLGTFKIQLFASESQKTVNNFVFLSRQGFYNGVIFHRIIKSFMIQTGDPLGTGMGGPGYKFADELPPKHKYDVGIVAMANSGPNTNGSQFFICTVDDSKSLAPNYTQLGQVVEGMDIVQKIASVQVTNSGMGEMSKPVNPPVINSITITEE